MKDPGGIAMKSFLLACAVAVIVTICVGVVFSIADRPADQTYKSSDVRL